jgi:predicted secreted protein
MPETSDKRSGKIVVVSHCILNVHSLEDDLSIYPGLEEEVIELLCRKGVGIYQIPCPEMEISGIFRKALPKSSYEHPKVRRKYRELADRTAQTLREFTKKGYVIAAVIGAEGSPTCGVDRVGRWKAGGEGRREFPRDIEFVAGTGVFMEEFKGSLMTLDIHPAWVGVPGKSIRALTPEAFQETLGRLEGIL